MRTDTRKRKQTGFAVMSPLLLALAMAVGLAVAIASGVQLDAERAARPRIRGTASSVLTAGSQVEAAIRIMQLNFGARLVRPETFLSNCSGNTDCLTVQSAFSIYSPGPGGLSEQLLPFDAVHGLRERQALKSGHGLFRQGRPAEPELYAFQFIRGDVCIEINRKLTGIGSLPSLSQDLAELSTALPDLRAEPMPGREGCVRPRNLDADLIAMGLPRPGEWAMYYRVVATDFTLHTL